jgi:thiol-disulfide isomerase/thioredoxin
MKLLHILFLTISQTACLHSKEKAKTGLEGTPLPRFSVLLSDSSTWIDFGQIPVGRQVVVMLFSPECPYCRAETRDIATHIDQFKNTVFYFVTPYAFRDMKSFYDQFELRKYNNIFVGRDSANFFLPYSKTTVFPYTAVYDARKRLKEAIIGKADINTLKGILFD